MRWAFICDLNNVMGTLTFASILSEWLFFFSFNTMSAIWYTEVEDYCVYNCRTCEAINTSFFKPTLKIHSCTAGLMAQSHNKSSGCKYLLVKSTVAVSFVHQTGCNTFKKRKLPYNTYFKQKLWADALMLKEERTFPFTTNIATLVHVNKQVPIKIIYWPDKLCRKKTSLTRNQQRF